MILLRRIFASSFKSCRFGIPRINNVQRMTFMQGIRPKKMNEQFYLAKDKVPKDYSLIYRAPMEIYLVLCKNVTSLTAAIVTVIVGYNYMEGGQLDNLPHQTGMGNLVTSDSDLIIFAVGFVLITLVLRFFISKYPLRIYKKDENYLAVFQGQLPFRNSKMSFNKGEAFETEPGRFNPWAQSMYKFKNKSVLLFTDYFKTPSELTNMLLPPVKKPT